MTNRTYTVTGGYTGQDKRIWVFVRGIDRAIPAEKAFANGAAVKVQGGRAVSP